MFYRFALDIPANTTEDEPVELEMPLTRGIIHTVHICFPDWLFGLVHVQIWHWEHQLWPTNPDTWFAWNNTEIVFDEEYELFEKPWSLTAKGYNDDDTYDHEVVIRIGLFSREEHLLEKVTKWLGGG